MGRPRMDAFDFAMTFMLLLFLLLVCWDAEEKETNLGKEKTQTETVTCDECGRCYTWTPDPQDTGHQADSPVRSQE